MTNPKWEEQILVVEVDKLFGFGDHYFNGVLTHEETVKAIMKNIDQNMEVKRRGNEKDPTPAENNMEINTNYKQPIPYLMLRKGNEIFLYKRLEGGGEGRLHDQLSIGVGGHMNKVSEGLPFGVTLSHNMYRELSEELNIDTGGIAPEANVIGLINDDNDKKTGIYHIGILVEIHLPERTEITVKETEELEGDWVRVQDLTKAPLFEGLESWSQLAAKELKAYE